MHRQRIAKPVLSPQFSLKENISPVIGKHAAAFECSPATRMPQELLLGPDRLLEAPTCSHDVLPDASQVLASFVDGLRDVLHWKDRSTSLTYLLAVTSFLACFYVYEWTLLSCLSSAIFWKAGLSSIQSKVFPATHRPRRHSMTQQEFRALSDSFFAAYQDIQTWWADIISFRSMATSIKVLAALYAASHVLNWVSGGFLMVFVVGASFCLPLLPWAVSQFSRKPQLRFSMTSAEQWIASQWSSGTCVAATTAALAVPYTGGGGSIDVLPPTAAPASATTVPAVITTATAATR